MVIFTPYEAPDNFTSMPYPGFEPRTFGEAAGFPSHYTAFLATLSLQLSVFILRTFDSKY